MHPGEEEVVARPSGPTIARWQLGRQLRELRDQAHYSHAQIAEVLACSESKIYKIESGDVGVGRGDLLVMLDRYQVSESQRETMIDLQRQGKERGWWARFGQLPNPYAQYVGLESAASAVKNFELAVIPGLLQIEAYTRALLKRQGVLDTEEDIERRVLLRLARQRCLTEEPVLNFWTIIDEGALLRQVGGSEVMHDQLNHLNAMAKLPNVTVQVLPFSEGPHPGTLGSLAILEFPENDHSPVAYAETYAGGVYLESPEELRRVTLAYTHMQAAALSVTKSADLIAATNARRLA
jgi:transcriptional regulator with XRE-family HTH domain